MIKRLLVVVKDNIKLPELGIFGPISSPTLISLPAIKKMLENKRTVYACHPRFPRNKKRYIKLTLNNYDKPLFPSEGAKVCNSCKIASKNNYNKESNIKVEADTIEQTEQTDTFHNIPEMYINDTEEGEIISGTVDLDTTSVKGDHLYDIQNNDNYSKPYNREVSKDDQNNKTTKNKKKHHR